MLLCGFHCGISYKVTVVIVTCTIREEGIVFFVRCNILKETFVYLSIKMQYVDVIVCVLLEIDIVVLVDCHSNGNRTQMSNYKVSTYGNSRIWVSYRAYILVI